jgi:hypothetical protein
MLLWVEAVVGGDTWASCPCTSLHSWHFLRDAHTVELSGQVLGAVQAGVRNILRTFNTIHLSVGAGITGSLRGDDWLEIIVDDGLFLQVLDDSLEVPHSGKVSSEIDELVLVGANLHLTLDDLAGEALDLLLLGLFFGSGLSFSGVGLEHVISSGFGVFADLSGVFEGGDESDVSDDDILSGFFGAAALQLERLNQVFELGVDHIVGNLNYLKGDEKLF